MTVREKDAPDAMVFKLIDYSIWMSYNLDMKTKAIYEVARDSRIQSYDLFLTLGTSPHFHHQLELLVVSKGSITVSINEVTQIMHKGHICISDSYDVHAYYPEKDAVGHVLIVPKEYLTVYASATKNMVLAENFTSDKDAYEKISELINLLAKDKKSANDVYTKGIITAIMGVFLDTLPYKNRAKTDKTLHMRDVLIYMYDNYAEKLTLESIARHFGYTPNHFSHVFNSYTGFGINEFLNTMRCENAAALIASGANVTDAAFGSGFESLRTFYRSFTKLFGMPPSKYAKTKEHA